MHRGILVFEATGCLGDQVEKEVLVVGKRTPQPQVLADHRLEILRGLAAVEHAALALVHQVMLLAVDRELIDRGVANDNRRVDQRIEVRGAIPVFAASFGEAGERTTPARGRHDRDFVRQVETIGERDERRRTVEQREIRLDPVGADGHLAPVDAIFHFDRCRARRWRRASGSSRTSTPAARDQRLKR